MNEENRTTEYEDIVKNMTPYPQKIVIAVELRCISMTGRNFVFPRNAVLDTQEYTSTTDNDQSLGTFSWFNNPWFWD